MIDREMLRLMTVQLEFIEESQFYPYLGQGIHMRATSFNHFEAAAAKAIEALKLLYNQFLPYFEDMLTYYLQQVVELGIYWMRFDHPGGEEQPFIAKYAKPLASFRHVLGEGVKLWVKEQMDELWRSLPDFAVTGELFYQSDYKLFADRVKLLNNVDKRKGCSKEQSDSLRDAMIQSISKVNQAMYAESTSHSAKEIDLVKEKPLDYALQLFALQHQRFVRRIHHDWHYVKPALIFGDPSSSDRSMHLKNFLLLITTKAVRTMDYTGFNTPLTLFRLHGNSRLHFVDELDADETDEYLGNLYGIEDQAVRGSARLRQELDGLIELLSAG
jgi:hypothetical protein